MSKKKRMGRGLIVTLILALAMTMGLGIATFAQPSYAPVPGPDQGITITKDLDLHGSTDGPEHTVTFTTAFQTTTSGLAPSGTVAPVTMTFSGSKATDTKDIDFSTVTFSKPGEYRFKVTENIEAGKGIRSVANSPTQYIVVFYVENVVKDAAGTSDLEIAATKIYKDTETDANKVTTLKFDNEWDNYRVNVAKDVKGNQGDKSKEFTIYAQLSNWPGNVNVNVKWVSGTPKANNTDVSAGNPLTVAAPTGSAQKTITLSLKDGDKVTIEGMTSTMSIRVYEADASKNGYVVSGEMSAAQNVVQLNDQTVTITNEKNGTIPTGIFINNWPYLLVMSVAVVLAVIFVKRRNREIVDF